MEPFKSHLDSAREIERPSKWFLWRGGLTFYKMSLIRIHIHCLRDWDFATGLLKAHHIFLIHTLIWRRSVKLNLSPWAHSGGGKYQEAKENDDDIMTRRSQTLLLWHRGGQPRPRGKVNWFSSRGGNNKAIGINFIDIFDWRWSAGRAGQQSTGKCYLVPQGQEKIILP